MRLCSRCKSCKETAEFKRRSGRRSNEWDPWCKACHVEYTFKWRSENKERVKAQRWDYFDRNRPRLQGVKRKYYERNKAKYRAWAKKQHAKSPLMAKARKAVANAIKMGRLFRLPCVNCGAKKSEAHHPDYSKPLDVIWACRICHERIYHHGKV